MCFIQCHHVASRCSHRRSQRTSSSASGENEVHLHKTPSAYFSSTTRQLLSFHPKKKISCLSEVLSSGERDGSPMEPNQANMGGVVGYPSLNLQANLSLRQRYAAWRCPFAGLALKKACLVSASSADVANLRSATCRSIES